MRVKGRKVFILCLKEYPLERLKNLIPKVFEEDFIIEIQGLEQGCEVNKQIIINNRIDLDGLYRESYEESFSRILGLSDYVLPNGVALIEHLKGQDGYSWWYYFRFMLLYKYRIQLYYFELIERLKAFDHEYEEVYILGEQGLRVDLPSDKYCFINSSIQVNTNKVKNLIKFIFITISRFSLALFNVGAFFKNTPNIFISNADLSQKVIERNSFSSSYGDHYSQYLQEDMGDENSFMNLSEYFPPKLGKGGDLSLSKARIKRKFKNEVNLELLLYIQLLNPFFYKRALSNITHTNYQFQGLQELEGLDGKDKVLFKEMMTFRRLCTFLAVRKSALYWFFKMKKVKSIGGTNENDVRVRSLLEVGKKSGALTYGVQHGVIHESHIHYMFKNDDLQYNPMTDYFFTWGEYWNSILAESSKFNLNSLITVGQVRTDVINTLTKLNKNSLDFQLEDNKLTIVFASQKLHPGEESMRQKLAHDVLLLSLELPDIQIVIKPHPKEDDCVVFMSGIASKIKTTNYQVVNAPLYAVLAISDLVIVYNSTVGSEALYFNKPLVVMDYANNDFSNYVGSKVASGVSSYQELKETVFNIISGKALTNKVVQENYVNERAYKIDGNVSKRIIEKVKVLSA